MEITKELAGALASPFSDDDVKWKPQVTEKKDRKSGQKVPIMRGNQQVAGCTAHIDARAVMNRLDEVVGVGNWSDSYQVLPNGKNVQCTLTVCGISKSDVGEPNEGGFADNMKAAYSDALKRAAVKFGIGRYLYDMEMEWLPYDGYKILSKPQQQAAQKQPAQNGNGVADDQRKPTPERMKAFHAAGTAVYGDDWPEKRKEIVSAVTKGRTDSSKKITLAEYEKLMRGIQAKADQIPA